MDSHQSFVPRHAWKRKLLILIAIPCLAFLVYGQSNSTEQNHEQRANAYLREKNTKLAIEEYRAALAADPANLNVQTNLGVLLFFQKDYAEAVPLLRKTSAQRPDLTKIRTLLGLAEMHIGQTSQARLDLEATFPQLEEPAVRIDMGLSLMEIYVSSNNLDKAAEMAASLRRISPSDPRIIYASYRIATDQAGEAMLSLAVVAPESAQMHQMMAHELERSLDVAGAIRNFREAVALDPTLPGIHYELAEALLEANDEKLRAEAMSQFRLAIEQNPRDARSAIALGNLTKAQGRSEEAQKYFSQAFAIDPELPGAAVPMAESDEQKGDLAAAEEKLRKVIKADPSNIQAHYRLFIIYRSLGKQDDSKHELDEFMHLRDLKAQMGATFTAMRQRIPGEE
jgi:tetratricopeptide (TPR) repeat protein